MNRAIFIGWDPREADAFAVARRTMKATMSTPIPVYGLVLADLEAAGIYRRPMERDAKGKLFDVLSKRPDYDGAISTEHANARFAVLEVARRQHLDQVLFVDGDILVRADINELFDSLDPKFAVSVVKHDYAPANAVKMDGRAQTRYSRKNWSSVMAFEVNHAANDRLTPDLVNSAPGRDLHALSWLRDDEIGALDPAWNWLAGHSSLKIDPKIVHHTEGTPSMPGYHDAPYAEEWRAALAEWARG